MNKDKLLKVIELVVRKEIKKQLIPCVAAI